MFDTVSLPASELLLGKLISYLRAYQNYLKKDLLLAEQLRKNPMFWTNI
jgi:hypothetical protein